MTKVELVNFATFPVENFVSSLQLHNDNIKIHKATLKSNKQNDILKFSKQLFYLYLTFFLNVNAC